MILFVLLHLTRSLEATNPQVVLHSAIRAIIWCQLNWLRPSKLLINLNSYFLRTNTQVALILSQISWWSEHSFISYSEMRRLIWILSAEVCTVSSSKVIEDTVTFADIKTHVYLVTCTLEINDFKASYVLDWTYARYCQGRFENMYFAKWSRLLSLCTHFFIRTSKILFHISLL